MTCEFKIPLMEGEINMVEINIEMSRRQFIKKTSVLSAATILAPAYLFGKIQRPVKHAIPSTGEELAVIGMGTSRTFDIGNDPEIRSQLVKVLQAFFDNGGALIDSSPMYGNSEAVLGDLLKNANPSSALFTATKVWIDGRQAGIKQMQDSARRMGVKRIDLMQIHNLRDWKTHLPTLQDLKQKGLIRYIGITTSHGRYHDELAHIMKTESLDFVQFSYNIDNRAVEKNLLPLAADRGIATLINRPYARGELFKTTRGKSLPDWCREFDCFSWGQFFLKFIVSHPAVTCVIPATSKVHHMEDNMGAGFGRLPDVNQRKRMLGYYQSL